MRLPVGKATIYLSHSATGVDGCVEWFVVEGGEAQVKSLRDAGRTVVRVRARTPRAWGKWAAGATVALSLVSCGSEQPHAPLEGPPGSSTFEPARTPEQLVLELVRKTGPATLDEVVRATGLSEAQATALSERLVRQGKLGWSWSHALVKTKEAFYPPAKR